MQGPEGISFNPEEFNINTDQDTGQSVDNSELKKIELEISSESEKLLAMELLRSELTAATTLD